MFRATCTVVLLALSACGRIGFDPPGSTTDVGGDGVAMGIEPPIMSVDPAGLPPFGTPIVVPGLSLPGIDDDDPALSRDQLEIFFDSFRGGNDDLYTAHRASIAEPWTTPVPLTAINTPSAEEHPALSANGLTLYFTSARGGDSNVWMTTRADRS